MSDKPTTTDKIAVLLAEGDSVEYSELIDKLTDLFNQNSHKIYDKFSVVMLKDTKLGVALAFEGEREESKEETALRVAEESATSKRVKDLELKEYLRLKKIYGKKNK